MEYIKYFILNTYRKIVSKNDIRKSSSGNITLYLREATSKVKKYINKYNSIYQQ